jgi:hypothetical protein
MATDPRILLGAGFLLLVTGFVLPLLMIMQILPSTFFLNFFAYGASFMGLMLGIIGAISITLRRKDK